MPVYKCVDIVINNVIPNRYVLVKISDDKYVVYDKMPNAHSKTKSLQIVSATPKKAGGPGYCKLRDINNKRIETIQLIRDIVNTHKQFFDDESKVSNITLDYEEKTNETKNTKESEIKETNNNENKEIIVRNKSKLVKMIRVNKETLKVDGIFDSLNEAARANGTNQMKFKTDDEYEVINSITGYFLKYHNENIGDFINIHVKGSTAFITNETNEYQFTRLNSDFIVDKFYRNRVEITEIRNDFKITERGFYCNDEIECYFKKYEGEKIGDKLRLPDEIIKQQILRIDNNGNIIKKYFSINKLFKDNLLPDDEIRELLRNKSYFEYNNEIFKRREYGDEDNNIILPNKRTYDYGKKKEDTQKGGEPDEIELHEREDIESDEINNKIKLMENEKAKIIVDKKHNIKDDMYVITNKGRVFNNNNGQELSGEIDINNNKCVNLQHDDKTVKYSKKLIKIKNLVYYHFISDTIPKHYKIEVKDCDINNNSINNLILKKINRPTTIKKPHPITSDRIKRDDDGNKIFIDGIEFKKVDNVRDNKCDKYYVSSDGKVYSEYTKTILNGGKDAEGYKRYTIYANGKKITSVGEHKLTSETYDIEDSERIDNKINGKRFDKDGIELMIHHKDENKSNNNISNHQWVSNRENMIFSVGKAITCINKNGEVIKIFTAISLMQDYYGYKRLHPSNKCVKATKFDGYYRYYREGDEIEKNVGIN